MNHLKEAEYSVPPKWAHEPEERDATSTSSVKAIEFRGGIREPGCYDGWCRSTGEDLIRWKGPSGSEKQWIDAKGEIHEFAGRRNEDDAEEL